MESLRELGKIGRKIEKYIERIRLLGRVRPRIFFANPDLCISICPYFTRPDYRYYIKKGAKKGHLVVSLGWLWATIHW